ncbi:MAG: FAD-dependent thymidylate synthase [Desulfobacteraceae bacterium]|jgi:thymidylate synthase (FAD)
MRLIEQHWQWTQKPENALEIIEYAGRTCYKSEEKITPGSAEKFARMLMKSGHESVMEHVNAGVRFITNRGVTHELVRHRLAAYSQESTRYVNYKNREMAFIKPVWWEESTDEQKECFLTALKEAEAHYNHLIASGWKPQQAREVLPNALKTEIVVTANLRQWRHIFTLRTAKAAHPQIISLMRDCLEGFKAQIPVLFDNILG